MAFLFKDALLMIDETRVEGEDMNYPYNGYLKTVSQFTPEAETNHMLTSGRTKMRLANLLRKVIRALQSDNQ